MHTESIDVNPASPIGEGSVHFTHDEIALKVAEYAHTAHQLGRELSSKSLPDAVRSDYLMRRTLALANAKAWMSLIK